MTARAWLLLTRNQALGFVREPAAAVFNLAIPFFIILVQAIAFGNDSINQEDLPGYRSADVLPVGAAVIYVMIIGVFGMGVGLASMAESRTLSVFRLRPGGVGSILVAYAVVLVGLTAGGLALSTVVLDLGWHIRAPARPLTIVPLTLAGCALFLAIGACVASLSSSPRAAQGIASAIFFPLLFLSGAMFPLDNFPRGLRYVAHVLPGYHVNETFAYSWFRVQEFPWVSLVYLAGLSVAAAWLAVVRFRNREDL